MNLTYDFIIPIGDHCAISIILKELGIRRYSYPFDWTFLGYNDLNKTNIMINCELINDLKMNSVNNVVEKYIGNAFDHSSSNKTNSIINIGFPHDCGTKDEIMQKYERRFERLKTHLNGENVFIMLTRCCFIDESTFDKIMDILFSFNCNSKIVFISGIDHEYFSNNTEKYRNVIFKHIYYDINQFYNYDYTHFRPNINAYLSTLF